MKQATLAISAFLILLTGNTAFAQDSIMNKEVEVIKAFQPTISDANKIVATPKVIDTVKYTPIFDYKIQSSLVPVSRTIQNLPVVQLGNPPKSKSNMGYVQAGFGNAITPYAEFALNTSPAKSTDFGIFASHFSSNPKIELNNGIKTKAPYSDNEITIFIRNKFKKTVLDWNIGYERNRFNYYGFPGTDTLLYHDSEKISPTLNKRQVFNNASLLFNLRKIEKKSDIDYNLTLGYNYFGNLTGQRVHRGSFNGDFAINKRDFDLIMGSEISYFYQDSMQNPYKQKMNHQFVYVGISPQYVYEKKNILLKAGINLSTIIDNDTSAIFHLSPKIYFEYQPIKDMLSLFAGTDGKLNTNDYLSIMQQNRYLQYNEEVKPSKEVISFYGGFKGKFSRNMSYVIDAGYTIDSDVPFFYQTQVIYATASDEMKNLFRVKYADLNTFRLGGNIRYSSKNISVGIKGNYYSYTTESNMTLTHLPAFDGTFDASVAITSQIKARLGATVIGPRKAEVDIQTYAQNTETGLLNDPLDAFRIDNLKTIVDISAGADYSYNKKLSFSLDIRNLINQKYEIWNGYNAQGILIMAGARYTF